MGYKFDVIGISETKINKNKSPIFDINMEDYKCYHTPSEAEKGGAMLYIQNDITSKPRNDLDSLVYKSKQLESIFIEIINAGQKNTIVGCIYRHPSMDLEELDEIVNLLMEKIGSENKNIFLMGAFNVDLMKTESDTQSSQFFRTITSNLLIPHIIFPTRITTTSSTLIDNIFSNSLNFCDGISSHLTSTISDHLAQFLIVPMECHKVKGKHNFFKRDTRNFDRENFLLDFLEINWQDTIDVSKNDPNYSFNSFESKLNILIDKYLPLKKLSNREIKHQLKPWISLGIRPSIKRRDKLYKKYLKAKTAALKEDYHKKYREIRNQIVGLCRKSKKLHFQKFFTENANNAKDTWKGIKSIINIDNGSKTSPTSLIVENKLISEPTEIANNFNNYYSSVAKKLQGDIHYCGQDFKSYLKNKNYK